MQLKGNQLCMVMLKGTGGLDYGGVRQGVGRLGEARGSGAGMKGKRGRREALVIIQPQLPFHCFISSFPFIIFISLFSLHIFLWSASFHLLTWIFRL